MQRHKVQHGKQTDLHSIKDNLMAARIAVAEQVAAQSRAQYGVTSRCSRRCLAGNILEDKLAAAFESWPGAAQAMAEWLDGGQACVCFVVGMRRGAVTLPWSQDKVTV
jgi:hypothetical protein